MNNVIVYSIIFISVLEKRLRWFLRWMLYVVGNSSSVYKCTPNPSTGRRVTKTMLRRCWMIIFSDSWALFMSTCIMVLARPAEKHPIFCQWRNSDYIVGVFPSPPLPVYVLRLCLANKHTCLACAVANSQALHSWMPRAVLNSSVLVQSDVESCTQVACEGGTYSGSSRF